MLITTSERMSAETRRIFRKIKLKSTQATVARPLKSLLWIVATLIGNYVVVNALFSINRFARSNFFRFPITSWTGQTEIQIGIRIMRFAMSVWRVRACSYKLKNGKWGTMRNIVKDQLCGDKWFLMVVFNYFFNLTRFVAFWSDYLCMVCD